MAGHSAVYGAADVFTNVVNLAFTPVYLAYLSTSDYGSIALLALYSTLAKIVFRMGLDAGFFRVYYDQPEDARRGFAGTVALFSAASSTLLFLAVFAVRHPLTTALLGSTGRPLWVLLATADVYFSAFSFVPQNLLRIQDRARAFTRFAILRHSANTLLKFLLLVTGFGVTGVIASDAAASLIFALLLAPTLRREASLAFTARGLAQALHFGLPKVPHGLMLQIQNLADRRILLAFVDLGQVGLYQYGYTLASGVKFALSAFEPAWQPFVYAQIGRPDARTTLARIVTYVWAGFLTVGLGFAVLGRELLMLLALKNHAFWAAAPIIPVVVLAYLLQGAFLLTSIGIGIEKRARYYPAVTFVSASANIALNFALIPRLGMLGAAWATVLSYAIMAGLGFLFSHRLYPLPLEWPRLARVTLAASAAFGLSLLAPAPLVWTLLVKAAALAVFPALLLGLGTLRPEERSWLGDNLRARLRVWP